MEAPRSRGGYRGCLGRVGGGCAFFSFEVPVALFFVGGEVEATLVAASSFSLAWESFSEAA